MDIFKLIFEHDIILEHLAGTEDPRHTAKKELSIEDFMKPTPTYAKYYLTGTQLEKQEFGLTALQHYPVIKSTLAEIFGDKKVWDVDGNEKMGLEDFLKDIKPYDYAIIGQADSDRPPHTADIFVDEHTNVRDRLPQLTALMDKGYIILYAEKAHNGTDLHFFTAKNIYEDFFLAFQTVVQDDLRYFSINGKKVKSERNFYFETWTLERPPHGFEEVTSASRLR